ncbi:MAG: Ig-like domain-containing protein [Blastocatellia bacterium]|nr:Ig-like domain-containing protein [Blastocatellia bacterium]
MIGRAEQVDVVRGLSLTSACGACCPPTFFDGWCDPGSVTGFPGDTSQFTAKQRKQDCYGNILSATTVLDASWTSTNTAVATVNANGLATAQGAGSTNINATWDMQYIDYYASGCNWDPDNCTGGHCYHRYNSFIASALCDVLAIRFMDVTLIGSNQTAQFNQFNSVSLTISTTTGPDACGGDRFSIKAKFQLPQYSAGCCSNPTTSFVILSSDNKFEFAPSLIDGTTYDFFGNDSPPYVIVYLRRKADRSGTTNSVKITVGGTYQNGESYTGQGTVHLVCP